VSWVKIDDKAWAHPKLASLSGNAVRLWVFALCWCNQQETDGAVPKSCLRVLGGSNKDAQELVSAGLWHPTETGWDIHDFLVYQPSKAQLAAQREAKAEAGRSGGRRSGEARRQAKANQTGSNNEAGASGLVEPKRTPDPDPDPDPEIPSGSLIGAFAPQEPPTPKPPRAPRSAPRWRKVPADWAPNPGHHALAADLRVDLVREEEKFRDHEFKDPKSDADAAFRTWLRNAANFGRAATPRNSGNYDPFEEARRLRAEENARNRGTTP
jgi:hypothetical protein